MINKINIEPSEIDFIRSVESVQDIKNNNLDSLVNKTIKKVTKDLEDLRHNTAISTFMIFSNGLVKEKNIRRRSLK